MKLRKECEHGRYDRHWVARYDAPCPGGGFLADGALVIEKVDGEWPEGIVNRFVDEWHTAPFLASVQDFVRAGFDALVSLAGETS